MTATDWKKEVVETMKYNNIYVTQVARKLNRHRVTMHLWLNDMTEERFNMMMKAINEIISEKGIK